MKFSDCILQVLEVTKRPERRNTVIRELNAALTFYSMDGNFKRDFKELTPSISATDLAQSIALSTFERFRKFRYIKRAGTSNFLSPLGDAEIFDPCCSKADKYYIVGDNVNINMTTLAAALDVGWFAYPPLFTGAITDPTYWMLDVNPYMIIDRACAAVFRAIGQENDFKSCSISARESYLAMRKDVELSLP